MNQPPLKTPVPPPPHRSQAAELKTLRARLLDMIATREAQKHTDPKKPRLV